MNQIEQQPEAQKPAKRKRTRKPKDKKSVWGSATVIAAFVTGAFLFAAAYVQYSNQQATQNINSSVNANASSAVAIGGNAVAISGNGNNSPVTVNGNTERPSREDKFLEILKVTGKIIDSVKREQTNNIEKSSSTSSDANGKL